MDLLLKKDKQTIFFACAFVHLFMLVLAKTYSKFNTDSEYIYIYTFNGKM